MEFRDIKDVLTFAAFRPEADNPRFPWSKRFPGRKACLVNVGRGQVSWAFLNKRGKVENTGVADGEFTDVAAQMADGWRQNSDDGWIGVSLNNRFVISLEHNLSRTKGWEDTVRTNPKSILGTKCDRTKRYALHHNPETSASLVLASDESMIKTVEESMRSHNIRPARICCGLFAMTGFLLNRINSDAAFKDQNLIVITWCDNSLCVLRQKKGQWQELRSRSGLSAGDTNAIQQMLKPYVESADPETRVVFMGEAPENEFAKQYMGLLGNLHVTDVTEPHQLWTLLGQF
ncbi:MAG: hypothetical protein HKN23_21730 [Verrucomicrobiales bacterium]|nr:hypothetical protein [Verrucomicrobiales bacterium]